MLDKYIQNFIHYPAVKTNSICKEITGDQQCGFQCNRSTTDHIFCICHIVKKMGILSGSESAVYRLQESLCIS